MFDIDWKRYYELSSKPDKDLTEEELAFVKTMYHMEEVRAGLDGDE